MTAKRCSFPGVPGLAPWNGFAFKLDLELDVAREGAIVSDRTVEMYGIAFDPTGYVGVTGTYEGALGIVVCQSRVVCGSVQHLVHLVPNRNRPCFPENSISLMGQQTRVRVQRIIGLGNLPIGFPGRVRPFQLRGHRHRFLRVTVTIKRICN